MDKPLTVSKELAECSVLPCPKCGAALSKEVAVANDTFRQPEPGDVSLCYTCTAFLKFNEKLERVALTDEEALQLPPAIYSDLCRVRALILVFKQKRQVKI